MLFVPDLTVNLPSISKINTNLHCTTEFSADSCVFQEMASGKTIGAGLFLFLVSIPNGTSPQEDTKTKFSYFMFWNFNKESDVLLWHSRLGHVLKNFHPMIQTQFSTQLHVLCNDRARDYFNSVLESYLASHGIVHQSSCVNTP